MISEDHYRIAFDLLLCAHEEALEFVGRHGIQDEQILRSAIDTPYVGYYPIVHAKAAALLRGLACNHGFIDGNKRTAILITEPFVRRCGFRLNASDEELKEITLSLVLHKITIENIVKWISTKLEKDVS
ncbi:MAG: Fic family protein [Pseudomonadales bacterium]|nr:Fic family protein [Pseudomonadales bacterium]